jgi:hypothetical protein
VSTSSEPDVVAAEQSNMQSLIAAFRINATVVVIAHATHPIDAKM